MSAWDVVVIPSSLFIQLIIGALIIVLGIRFIYPNYVIIKDELGGFIDHYQKTNIAWVSSFLAPFLALTVGSNQGMVVKLLILGVFIAPAAMHMKQYYPFTLLCNYVSVDETGGNEQRSESKKNVATIEDDGRYCLTLSMTAGKQIEQYTLDVDPPPGVRAHNVESAESPHDVGPDGSVRGIRPTEQTEYDIHLYLKLTGKLSEQGPNTVTIRDHSTDRVLESVELLPQ